MHSFFVFILMLILNNTSIFLGLIYKRRILKSFTPHLYLKICKINISNVCFGFCGFAVV